MRRGFFVILFLIFMLSYSIAFADNTDTLLVKRIAGSSRFDTAIAISQAGWTSAETVFLAYGYNYPDALLAVTLAYRLDGPILLCHKTRISQKTFEEIKNLNPKEVVILGGEAVIEKSVANQLMAEGFAVRRIAGGNRYETAKLLGDELIKIALIKPTIAILVSGNKFPDALSVGVPAAINGWPILLCRQDSIPAITLMALSQWGIKDIIIVGGEMAVKNEHQEKLEALGYNVTRIRGDDRYETSETVGRMLMSNPKGALVATGEDFPDALSGGVLAAKMGWPLILTRKDSINTSMLNYLESGAKMGCFFLGGNKAISDEVVEIFEKIFPSPSPTLTISPSPIITISPSPIVTASPITPSPSPAVTASPSPVVTPSLRPVVTPSLRPVVTPSPSLTVTASPSPVVTPSPSPTVTPLPTIPYPWDNQSLLAEEINLYMFTAPYSGAYKIWSYSSDINLDNAGYLLEGNITIDDIPNDYWQSTYDSSGGDLSELIYNDTGFLSGSTFRMTYNLIAGQSYTILVRGYDENTICDDFSVNVEYSEDIIEEYSADNFDFTAVVRGSLPTGYYIDIKANEVAGISRYEYDYFADDGDFGNSIKGFIDFKPKNPQSEIASFHLNGLFADKSVTLKMRPIFKDNVTGIITYGEYSNAYTLNFPIDNVLSAFGTIYNDDDGNMIIRSWDAVDLADGYYVYCPTWNIEIVNVADGSLSFSYDKNDADKQGSYFYLYAYCYENGVKMLSFQLCGVS